MSTNILAIEEHLFRARPALETRYYDGWVLRFADGFTRRANSVNPLYDGGGTTSHTETKIIYCEEAYAAHDLPTIFRLTPVVYPDDLDAQLDAIGYEHQPGALVQTADLTDFTGTPDPDMEIIPTPDAEWLITCARLNEITGAKRHAFERTLMLTKPQTAYIALRDLSGAIIALGQGVAGDGYLGMFSIVTAEAHRQQGIGRRLIESLLAWGKTNEAHTAYLQVLPDNTDAIRLYEKIGFHTAYQYWYRQKPMTP